MERISAKEIILLIFCLLLGFTLRFYRFDQKSLWWDEIYTYNDSRFGLKEQITFYKENPTFLHPPLFFLLTHLFYPFTSPERDLRLIPLIFGTLSIPMIYLLSKSFLPAKSSLFTKAIFIPARLARPSAPALGLSQTKRARLALILPFLTALIIAAKFVPRPEAKTAIFIRRYRSLNTNSHEFCSNLHE